jgi:hypothetical protein
MCDQGKTEYRTESAARSAISGLRTKGNCPDLRVYEHGDHFHITKTVPRRDKVTRPSSRGPAPFIPSAAKLRRKLAEAANQIKATERRLSSAERAYFEELAYVQRETERIMAGRSK